MVVQKTSSDTAISLFSGAGGFSLGFARAGLKPDCGAEINSDAAATYEHNLGSKCHVVDLAKAEQCHFVEKYAGKSPLVIIGGPPCQGFSTAGTRAHGDPRNQLIFNYLELVRETEPRWFIFENVEGLLTSGGGVSLHHLSKEFLKLGYSIRIEKLNFAAYGVPQTRKRVIIMGNRLGIDFELPAARFAYNSGKARSRYELVQAPSVMETLSGLPRAAGSFLHRTAYETSEPSTAWDAYYRQGNGMDVSLHGASVSSDEAARYALLGPGQTMKDLPERYWHASYARRANRRVSDGTPPEKRGGAPSGFKRLHANLQALTITGAASRELIHPIADRPITLRESARLQTFPDNFEFCGRYQSISQQIGNAVPPLAAEVLAKHLLELEGRFGAGRVSLGQRSGAKLLGFRLTDATGMSPALQNTQRLLETMLQTTSNLDWSAA